MTDKERIFRIWVIVLLLLIMSPIYAKKFDQIKIGICSDVHLPTMHDSRHRIQVFIDSMTVASPDFIIELGDFGTPAEKYAALFDIWDSFPGDKYHVIGNHEMDGGFSERQALDYRGMKSPYYSFDKNGFHFILLDGNDPHPGAEKGYKQYIGPEQIDWLKQDLDLARHPVVIFSHQGLTVVPGADEVYGIENCKQVRKILDDHNEKDPENSVIACFNGHSHYDFAEKVKGIWYITINSMSYKWLGESYPCVRYSNEVDKNFKWIKYTAPYRDPLFTVVEISLKGYIHIEGRKTKWVGPSPWQLGFPESLKKYIRPAISERTLRFKLRK